MGILRFRFRSSFSLALGLAFSLTLGLALGLTNVGVRHSCKNFSNRLITLLCVMAKKNALATACIPGFWKTYGLCLANLWFVACKVMVCGLQSHSSSDGESGFQFVHVAKVNIFQTLHSVNVAQRRST